VEKLARAGVAGPGQQAEAEVVVASSGAEEPPPQRPGRLLGPPPDRFQRARLAGLEGGSGHPQALRAVEQELVHRPAFGALGGPAEEALRGRSPAADLPFAGDAEENVAREVSGEEAQVVSG